MVASCDVPSLLAFFCLVVFLLHSVWCLPVGDTREDSILTSNCSLLCECAVSSVLGLQDEKKSLPRQQLCYALSTNSTQKVYTLNFSTISEVSKSGLSLVVIRLTCSHSSSQREPGNSVKDDDSCNAQTTTIIATAVLAGVLFVFIIVVGFLYHFKRELKLLLFTRLNWHPFDRVDDSDPSKIYDAFISHSGREHQWVMETLKEKLENEEPWYELCIHWRDFLVGAPIVDNIFDSVHRSRRMIMVLSNSYIQSNWCMMEFRTAHQQVLRERKNYLIIIRYEDVDTTNLDDDLKLYLRTNTYLSIDSKWFWRQLKYALPHKIRDTNQVQWGPEGNEGFDNETSL